MKITILLSRFPWPLDKGDKLRAYYQIMQLSQNHDINLIALTEKDIQQDAVNELFKFCKSVQIFRIKRSSKILNIAKAIFNGNPFQVGYFYNSVIHSKIMRTLELIEPDVVFCQLVRMAEYGKQWNGFKVLDYQDALSAGIKRRISTADLFFKQILKMEYKRMQRYENQIFDKFDKKIIITRADRNLIPHPQKENIFIVPNGVDMEHFYPRQETKEFDVIFAGNMNYPPNVDAAEFLAKDIMPLVWRQLPEAKLILAGANPAAQIWRLRNPKIHITGWVDDIADSYACARVFVAPMRIGTGLQNKLLEAMAMKLPSITTDLANEALKGQHNENILVGNTAEDLAKNVCILLNDSELYTTIAQSGYDFVKENYAWKQVSILFEEIIKNR